MILLAAGDSATKHHVAPYASFSVLHSVRMAVCII